MANVDTYYPNYRMTSRLNHANIELWYVYKLCESIEKNNPTIIGKFECTAFHTKSQFQIFIVHTADCCHCKFTTFCNSLWACDNYCCYFWLKTFLMYRQIHGHIPCILAVSKYTDLCIKICLHKTHELVKTRRISCQNRTWQKSIPFCNKHSHDPLQQNNHWFKASNDPLIYKINAEIRGRNTPFV